jgi:hypothetical protein
MSTMPAVTAEPACETASACVCLSEIALREPAKREGVLFKPAALKLAIQLTRGYPYFLQECGYHSWNVAKASPITVQDVKKASGIARSHLDESFFRVRFDRVTPREKDYIFAMAERALIVPETSPLRWANRLRTSLRSAVRSSRRE